MGTWRGNTRRGSIPCFELCQTIDHWAPRLSRCSTLQEDRRDLQALCWIRSRKLEWKCTIRIQRHHQHSRYARLLLTVFPSLCTRLERSISHVLVQCYKRRTYLRRSVPASNRLERLLGMDERRSVGDERLRCCSEHFQRLKLERSQIWPQLHSHPRRSCGRCLERWD